MFMHSVLWGTLFRVPLYNHRMYLSFFNNLRIVINSDLKSHKLLHVNKKAAMKLTDMIVWKNVERRTQNRGSNEVMRLQGQL